MRLLDSPTGAAGYHPNDRQVISANQLEKLLELK